MMEHTPGSRLSALRGALDILAKWEQYEWADVGKIAGEAAPLVWAELKERGVWDGLPEHDQAAMYWLLYEGYKIRSVAARNVTADVWGPCIDQLCSEAAHFAERCDTTRTCQWPETSTERFRQADSAVEMHCGYLCLPEEWRAEVLRRTNPRPYWSPDPASVVPELSATLADAAARAERHESPARVRDHAEEYQAKNSHEIVRRLARLPLGWQIEAVRRIALGETPTMATSEAAASINVLHSVFRVSLAWCAEPLPPLPH